MAQSAGRNRRSRATRPRRAGEALAVVKGLDVFQNHFARYADQYVLIGGTAATLAMEEAGLEFRATKDLDIVLHIEALRPDFGSTFWEFVEKGGYQRRETSEN